MNAVPGIHSFSRILRRPGALLLGALCIGAAVFLLRPSRRAAIHLERGRLFLEHGRHQAALRELQRSWTLAPPGWEARLLGAAAHAAHGQSDDAMAMWMALAETPVAAEALAAAADYARETGDLERALTIVEDGLARGMPPAPLLGTAALALLQHGDVDAAMARYHEIPPPVDPDTASAFIDLLAERGELALAEACAVAALTEHPGNGNLHLHLGNILHEEERIGDAIVEYQRALDNDPTLLEARFGLMQAYLRADRWGEAEAEAERAKSEPLLAPFAYLVLGRAAERQDDLVRAIDHFEQAARELTSDPLPHQWLAQMHMERGDVGAALDALRRAAFRAPEDSGIHLDLLRFLWEQDQWEEAWEVAARFPGTPQSPEGRALLEEVRATPPTALRGLDTVGLLAASAEALGGGDIRAARRLALVAHRRKPHATEPFLQLAEIAATARDARGALGYLEEAWRHEPQSAVVARARAARFGQFGRRRVAAEVLRAAAVAGGPEATALAIEAGRAFLDAGDPATAEQTLYEAGAEQIPAAALILAQAALQQERYEDAMRIAAAVDTPAGRELRVAARLAARDDEGAAAEWAALTAAGEGGTSVLELHFAPVPSGESRSRDPHMLARALAAGHTDAREPVAAAFGRTGALLGVVMLLEAGDAETAAAWQRDRLPDMPLLKRTDLSADRAAYRFALVCDLADRPAVAARFYAQAEPAHPALLEPVILNARRLQRLDLALRWARIATDGEPPAPRLWYARALLEEATGRPMDAATTVERGLRLNGENGRLLALAGRLAELRGDRAQALALLRRAYAATPRASVANDLAWLLLQDEATRAEGLELAVRTVGEAPLHAQLLDTLAWGYHLAGQPDRGLVYGNMAVLLAPFNVQMRYHRAELLAASGRPDAAREDCRLILAQDDGGFSESPAVHALATRLGLVLSRA